MSFCKLMLQWCNAAMVQWCNALVVQWCFSGACLDQKVNYKLLRFFTPAEPTQPDAETEKEVISAGDDAAGGT